MLKLSAGGGAYGGVLTPARFLALMLMLALAVRADDSLLHVRRAQAVLGAEIWSRVIRIENHTRASRYPRVLHALVFEVANILWFYTPADGTQSFSLHTNRLAEEKADFAPLLKEIEPGFGAWTILEPDPTATMDLDEDLPNGCFIESVAALRERLRRGEVATNPRLLSYYATRGRQGHTVLVYEIGDRLEVIDPSAEGRVRSFSRDLLADPLRLARALEGSRIAKARLLAIEVPVGRPLEAA